MADVPAQAVLNEAALKRVDPYVKEILDTAKYVALYLFNPRASEWEKTNVEGSLFVYSRTGEPFHNILVLNRLNTTNLIEPISDKLDLQLQEPFLLYRNVKSKIYGIWFYEKDECTRFASLIRELMEKSVGNHTQNNSNWGQNVDILNMLSKAQKDFASGKSSGKSDKGKSPQEVDTTPQSVMEFFAKAGGAPQKAAPAPPGIMLARQHSVTTKDASEKLNPLLHKLMSNPVHTVEQIEKQQRSITPQVDSKQALKNLMRPPSCGLAVEGELQVEERNCKADNGLNGFNFLRISSPSQSGGGFSQVADSVDVSVPHSSLETPSKPALMPPAMFTPSASVEPPAQSVFSFDKPEPLTRKQLLHALNYLLKTDTDFVTKIHEAYIKSLTDKGS